MNEKQWGHDELMYDLAEHLDRPERMLWTDMQLGPMHSPRPDIFLMAKTYSNPRGIVYEIKVSVADFRSDVTTGKWQKYLDFACGVYFACPKGLITKNDVPPTCGLILRSEKGWRSAKAPVLSPVDLDWLVMMKLLIDGIERHTPERRAKYYQSFIETKKANEILGNDVATAVQDLQRTRRKQAKLQEVIDAQLKTANESAQSIRDDARAVAEEYKRNVTEGMEELFDILELESGANRWAIKNKLQALRDSLSKDELVGAMRQFVVNMENSLSNAKKLIGTG